MAMLLTLLTAGAWAAPVAVSTGSAYWSKQYSIPESYGQYSLAFQSSDTMKTRRRIEKALMGSGAKPIVVPQMIRAQGDIHGYWPESNQSLWELPASSAAALVARLVQAPDLYYFDKQGGAPPAYPELYEKRDGLMKEAAAMGGRIDLVSSARGLLEEELTTLGRLIAMHERAAAAAPILVTFDGAQHTRALFLQFGRMNIRPRRTVYLGDDPAYAPVRLSTAAGQSSQNWTRSSPSVCGPPGCTTMVVSFPDAEKGNELSSAMARREGARELHPSCRNNFFPEMSSYRLSTGAYFEFPSPKALDRFRRRIQGKGGLIFYSPVTAAGLSEFTSVHERRQLLLDELRSESSVFAEVPMIRGLVEAEADRLAPFAQQYENALNRPSLEIIAVSPLKPEDGPR